MGHATHFLERLERLSDSAHLDLALALYHDSKLVRYILERARLPDGADRIALALEDRRNGPHIIVARDGGFVTCLGEDMSIGDRPVISRTEITRLGEQIEGIRVAVARMRESGESKRLLGRLGTSGSDLSREDFTALVKLAPMMAYTCMITATELVMELKRFERGYRRNRYRRMLPGARDELRRYWQFTWALGHLIALYGSRGRELAEMVGPGLREKHDEYVFFLGQSAGRTMFLPVVVRGLWTTAHGGRKRMALFKQQLQDSHNLLGVMMNALPLMAIGMRHRSVRAEVQKFLGRCQRKLEDMAKEIWELALVHAFFADGEKLFDAEDAARRSYLSLGALMAVRAGEHLPAGHPLRFERVEDVPEDLACAMPCNQDTLDLFTTSAHQLMLLSTIPWVVNAPIEHLYLPAAAIEAYGAPWQPDPVRQHLESHNHYFARDIPRKTGPRPGRNQPCPCGSGNKYKRCCGAA